MSIEPEPMGAWMDRLGEFYKIPPGIDEPPRPAAQQFLQEVGVEPTPDAVDQLLEAFVPALAIIAERGYDKNGQSWKRTGWRAQLFEVLKRADRLHFNSWRHGRHDRNNGLDIINYAGFYIRTGGAGEPWGIWGEPGTEEEK
jgi:hypothetical protein